MHQVNISAAAGLEPGTLGHCVNHATNELSWRMFLYPEIKLTVFFGNRQKSNARAGDFGLVLRGRNRMRALKKHSGLRHHVCLN